MAARGKGSTPPRSGVGLFAAVSIGVGGMIGAGIFIVYSAVNVAHLRVVQETGAHAVTRLTASAPRASCRRGPRE